MSSMFELGLHDEWRLVQLMHKSDSFNDAHASIADGAGSFRAGRREEILEVLAEAHAQAEKEFQAARSAVLGPDL